MAIFSNINEICNRLDWSILQNGWISLYWKKSILEIDVKWFMDENYDVVEFDCKSWSDVTEMHNQLKNKLNFPCYYGNNLDALNDCLADLEIVNTGKIIVLNQLDSIEFDTIQILLEIFADNARKHMLFGERLIVLAQVDNPNIKFEPVGGTSVIWNRREFLYSKRRI